MRFIGLIGQTPAEHLSFWTGAAVLSVGLVISHFLVIDELGHSSVNIVDQLAGSSLGFVFAWLWK